MNQYPALAKFLNMPIADLPNGHQGRDMFLKMVRDVMLEGGLWEKDKKQVEDVVKRLAKNNGR